ncbi:MAG: M55 family metallopeptidase [Defluviitaleaceae bacterium]|nr:M55 family metallopeptidase [Defluviitaleaceae bacterium]
MRQLIVLADMEGASGIFDHNMDWMHHGTEGWRQFGRDCITSDMLAVCKAAQDFGVDEILLYDFHYAGDAEFNIILEKLPPMVRVFDVEDRCMYYDKMRGQMRRDAFGIITLGQHARQDTPDSYFPHTIQSPPIKNIFVNGMHIAEIGTGVLNFGGTPYLANIGCQASMAEALELSDSIVTIPVKCRTKGWEPSPAETYPLIYDGVIKALKQANKAKVVEILPPYNFSMELCDGFEYDTNTEISWKGTVTPKNAEWTAPTIEMGLELFHHVRALSRRV